MAKSFQISLLLFASTQILLLPLENVVGAAAATGELLVDDVSDGPCLSVSEVMPHLYSGLNLIPIMTSGTYYIPMASKSLYRKYAEGLLGRPAASQKELDSMELTLNCGPLFSSIDNTGFPYLESPPSFRQTCVSAGLPSFPNLGIFSGNLNVDYIQAVCVGLPAIRPDGSTALHASSSFISSMDSIIWVNSDLTALLTYRCPADGLKDFKVVSKTKILKPEDVATIKGKLEELGFRKENVAFMKYNDARLST